MTSLSVQLTLDAGGDSPWIAMPTKSDESMALTAFSTNKPVHFQWTTVDITSCEYGNSASWANNTPLNGWWSIGQ